jgi:MoaA/NifB/PqqE/SkfB family radical SAM enzyme
MPDKLPDSICMLPWVSIETSPVGTVRPCCMAHEEITDENGEIYDLNRTDLETVYRSPYMQKLRQDFRDGEKPATCNRCWDEEAAGRISKRMNSRLRLKTQYEQVDWSNDNPDQLWFVDLKLGNICNLKCRICGSWSSSKWAAEEMDYIKSTGRDPKAHQAYTWLRQGNWPRKTETFWENMRSLLPNIQYLEFTGGEPWMIKEHFDLLEYAVDTGDSQHIDIHYNTNATQYPGGHWGLWKNFGRVDIAFSVDNVGDRFEYERYGAKWQESNIIIDEIHIMKNISVPNITTQLCFTINIQNVYYLDELLAWADTKSFGSVYFNMMHGPEHMSVQYMTPAARTMVLDKLKTMFWTGHRYHQDLQGVINFIEQGPGSDGTEFLRKMRQTDEYRKQCFTDTHPEIARAMGYE